MIVTSKTDSIKASSQKVYNLLKDCRRFEKMIPTQKVENLKVGEDFCEFEVPGIAKMRVELAACVEYTEVKYKLLNDKNLPAHLRFDIQERAAELCDLELTIEVEIPIFLSGMVKKPLQIMADTAVQKIKEAAECA